MAKDDKIKNKINEGVGKAKETVGKVTGDDKLRAKGAVQKNTAKIKDKVQDAVESAKGAFKKK
jgi:uncharacterized protein YjbJ (UPF0337 family)